MLFYSYASISDLDQWLLIFFLYYQYSWTGAADGSVAKLDDQRRSLLWKVRWLHWYQILSKFAYPSFGNSHFLFCFNSTSGVSASFGEMLLLVAMYFHSNQLSAIIDLVCSTLGMKVISSYFLSKEDVSKLHIFL